ncbi:hypothetical protein [Halosegnis sp.]|uniref:hypothetical protein n=1 Tax=Halosegnis sp. TaxID=2864959 RepID=UPI0035D503EA
MSDGWPTIPTERLGDGWEQVDRTEERVFGLPTAEVIGRTVVYGDGPLRERLAADVTRFLFATALEFQPPLPPGAGQLVASTVATSAREAFLDDLRDRGFRDLSAQSQGRMRVDSGARARLTSVRGRYEAGGESFDVTGWLAVWNADGFRLAGGAYPAAGPGVEEDSGFREDLFEFVRAVR